MNFAFFKNTVFTEYLGTTASEEYTAVITMGENHVENLMEKQLISRDLLTYVNNEIAFVPIVGLSHFLFCLFSFLKYYFNKVA